MPNVAFAYIYGPNLNQTLNDPTYMTYQFDTINSAYVNGNLQSNKTSISLIQNCQPKWLGIYNNIYKNLSCISGIPKIMNPPLKRPNSITQRLTLTFCIPGANANITCQNDSQIASVTAGGRLILIVNQPPGFDFTTGQISQTDYPF